MTDGTKTHPTNIAELPMDARALGAMVARLRYDALLMFLNGFVNQINADAATDFHNGRKRLAYIGDDIRKSVQALTANVLRAWKISKPHMTDELDETSPLV
jgi:hypothetical protein